MKPRNKREKYILEKINPLIDDNIINEVPIIDIPYFQNKTEFKNHVYICGNCGETIECVNNMNKCPNCNCNIGENINSNNGNRKWHTWKFYFSTEIVNEFQIIRFFEVGYFINKNKKSKIIKNEIARCFISENKKHELDISVLGLPIYTQNYVLLFRYNQDFTFLKTDSFAKMIPFKKTELFGKLILANFIKKRGYTYNKNITINPLDYFLRNKQENNFLETLYKLKQFNLINSALSNYWNRSLLERKKEILLMIKWGFKFNKSFDYAMFCDYLDLAENCGFDIKTPKILIFKNLRKAHDQMHSLYLAKKEEIELKLLSKKNIDYIANKSKYFNLDLGENNIKIQVLKNIKEFRDTGNILKHCVFSNKYYEKKESLILNCYFDNELFETAELNIKSLNLIQLRGKNNLDSIHHKDFELLIEKNKKLIRKVA